MAPTKLMTRLIRTRTRARWRLRNLVDRYLACPSTIVCPACEAHHPVKDLEQMHSKCMFGGGKLVRYICPECDLIFGTARMLAMDAEDLGQEYVDLYSTYSEGDATESEMEVFRAMHPKIGCRYLNYGCGRWSESIALLRKEGFDIYGYEPFAQDGPAPPPTHILTRPEQLQNSQFDGIMSHNFLEHSQDPAALFGDLDSILKPGGSMVHATPCYEYSYEFTRFHLLFFLGRSIERLAQRCGFEVNELQRLDGGQLIRTFRRLSEK